MIRRKTKVHERSSPPSARVFGARLTNPDKLLYPEAGITKRHVAEYFEAVSEWMLPHVLRRPVTFVRCQNGWSKGGFFQKHAKGGIAEGVRVVELDDDDDVLVIDDKKTLVGLAQMNVLEVHVWGARIDALSHPDLLVFDLDPDTAVEWNEVVATARLVRERLSLRGCQPLVKTTGGKGLHVCCVPPSEMTWKAAREMGRSLGEELEKDFPDRFVTSVSKAKRKGKILLDFARNHPGATFVAPYSPRARSNAPVSMPVPWEDLEETLPAAFTIKNAIERLRTAGDPWASIGIKS